MTNTERERLRERAFRLLYPQLDVSESMGREREPLPPAAAALRRRPAPSPLVTKVRARRQPTVIDHPRLPPVKKAKRMLIRSVACAQLEEWEYQDMLEAQDGRCALCRREPNPDRRLAIDHDHLTGIVRGLLCGNCNRGLGLFVDDPKALDRAAAYVRQWREGLTVGAMRRDLTG